MFLSFGFRVRDRLRIIGPGGDRLQIDIESIEALLPEGAVRLHPLGDVLERRTLERAGAPLRLPRLADEAGPFEHVEVLCDRRQAHRSQKWPREVGDIRGPLREAGE